MEESIKGGPSWERKKARTSKLTAQQLNERLDTIIEDSEAEEEGSSHHQQSGAQKTSATSRSSTKRIASVVAKWRNTQKAKLIQEMAFQGVLDLPQINKVDPEFTFWLLRRVDHTRRVIWIDDKTPVPIRDVDYSRVLGIPCGKLPVCGLDSKDPEDKIDFINLCIGTMGAKEEYCSLKAAEANVEKQYHGPMDKQQCDNFKVSFVVWLVCRWLAPICKPNNGSDTFWGALLKPDEISCYNWCAFALDLLFDAVRKFHNDSTSRIKIANLTLCPIFLQVFFLDYIKNDGMNQPARLPRIADYDYHILTSMIQQVNQKIQREADLKKQINHSDTYTLESFYEAVGSCKLVTKRKMALRWYGASLQRHLLLLRSSIFRDATTLVGKLEAEEVTDDEGSGGLGVKRSADGYTSGSDSATEGGAGALKRKKPAAVQSEKWPSFSLGFSDDEDDETTIIPPAQNGQAAMNSISEQAAMHVTISNPKSSDFHSVETNTQGILDNKAQTLCLLEPETCLSSDAGCANHPAPNTNTKPGSSTVLSSQELIQPIPIADGISFRTPITKGQSSKCISPATLTKCWSEAELVNRMEPWDNKLNLNSVSLAFEFTDSPVNKKKISSGKLAKSPWSQGLSHPKRDPELTRNFITWLKSTFSEELGRQWIMHAMPRYVEVTGLDLKEMLCGTAHLSYNLVDVAIRRLNQLDIMMYVLNKLIHWRHILESDFAMLVFAGEKVTTNSSIRKQFIGEMVSHQIDRCRMITIPALVRETWCAYFCDMKLKKFHVIDPLYKHENHEGFDEIHKPNVRNLKAALSECFSEFFEDWSPSLQDFGISYVKPLVQNVDKCDSGVLTLIAVRDFNGTDFSNVNGQDFLKGFKELLLHEVLSIIGNNAKQPDCFVSTIDLE